MKIGYARVSTDDQNMSLQLDALTAAGCEKVLQDEISGAATKRPGLDARQGNDMTAAVLARFTGREAAPRLAISGQARAMNTTVCRPFPHQSGRGDTPAAP